MTNHSWNEVAGRPHISSLWTIPKNSNFGSSNVVKVPFLLKIGPLLVPVLEFGVLFWFGSTQQPHKKLQNIYQNIDHATWYRPIYRPHSDSMVWSLFGFVPDNLSLFLKTPVVLKLKWWCLSLSNDLLHYWKLPGTVGYYYLRPPLCSVPFVPRAKLTGFIVFTANLCKSLFVWKLCWSMALDCIHRLQTELWWV